ncbi:hypothetical protein BGX34_001909 [Mortierella sp. NVP85]|nr:hypothetical protein BGX34_001909 [Mortierella sp. NVP85]
MDFTLCFQNSVLTLIPSAVLLILLSPRLHILLDKGRLNGVKVDAVFITKMVFVMAAFAIQVVLLLQIIAQKDYQSSTLLSTLIYLVALTGAALLHWYEHFNMANPSAGLLVFWLLTGLISIFPTRSWIQESPNGLSSLPPLLKLLFTITSFLVFLLENIPKPNRAQLTRPNGEDVTQTNPSPEPKSNYFAKITFFWLLPLLNLGKKKTLRMDDLWSVHPKLMSYPLYLSTKAKMDLDEAIASQKKAAGGEHGKGLKKGKFNLSGIIVHLVGYTILSAVIPRLLYIAALYVRPVLFSNLINFVNSYSETSKLQGIIPQSPWIGFGLLIAVFASGILSSLFDGQYQNICFNAGLKTRSVLVTMIYRKSLRLSSTSKQEGMGSIVNHMSTDIDKVVDLFNAAHFIWSAVLETVITIILLYAEVKYAIFASLGVVLIILVVAGACSPMVGKAQEAMMDLSDIRMKYITELVGYIKSIKLYAWEPYFANKISKVRLEQLNELRKFYAWITVEAIFLNSVVPFCIFATLSVYSAIAPADAPLDIRRIFTTITLINMLEDPMGMMEHSISQLISGGVAYKRLNEFFSSEEIDETNVRRNLNPASSIFAYEISNGTFGWYSPDAIQAAIEKKEKEAKEAKEDAKEDNPEDKVEKEMVTTSSIGVSSTLTLYEKKPEGVKESMGPVLHDINLRIMRGSFTAVVGRVGEGKSSLVGALLGEMYKYTGTVYASGSLAYVPQTAWILNDTVRNNVLFGRPYDRVRYLNTVRACALLPDFKMLGINLSGGQKQRISIARAVYADADVYIFDDPLSAVDAHVGEHIFKEVLNSILARKTRILITNSVRHLETMDQIMVIKQGRIVQDGPYRKLLQNMNGDFFRLIQESKRTTTMEDDDVPDLTSIALSKAEVIEEEDEEEDDASMDIRSASTAFYADLKEEYMELVERPTPHRNKSLHRNKSTMSLRRTRSTRVVEDDLDGKDDKDEVDEEASTEGRAGWKVYKFYLSTLGFLGLSSFAVVIILFLAIQMGAQLWLQRWGDENALATANQTARPHSNNWWIMTYFAWIIASAVMLAVAIAHMLTYMARKASKQMHSGMLGPMMRSPMSFFDVTSSGKIVNRFAHDINAVDIDLPLQFLNMMFIVCMAINIFGFCIAATPYFAIIMVPLGMAYYWLGGYFLVSSRELKRLDSAARSPMYAHFGETLAGLVSIRAFRDSNRFSVEATKMLDRAQQTSYLTNATTRWLQVMLDIMSVLVLTFVALLAILQRESVQAGLFSIVLSQIGVLTIVMSRILSTSCSLEKSIISVERVREYSHLPSEARDVIPDSRTDPAWPQYGTIVFNEYSTRYREGLDLVLKDVTFSIRGGERIGIVGRTGAGKSSVTLALFRIIEAAEGSITIDGIDISTLGLQELRSRITIIPQDPFLFGDSVRLNMDPFGKYTDNDIWAALESASLKTYIESLPEGLDTAIENGGENMSLGQRQLMSLARAMLAKNTRVLCLDEATAAIDIETDNAIQRALRREFRNCTVLTIAHRINTIMDSDRILVLEKGEVAEYNSPAVLLQNKDSIFYSLASASGHA